MRQAVPYYRVSTARQGRSGLGIEAQRDAVTRFAEGEGITLLSEFVEVETGKGSDALDRRTSARGSPRNSTDGEMPGDRGQARPALP
jgi:DNA invertase Pin-like site-specific DNA recombinase